ncbi:MAG: SH3 domain-containing protein [Parasphingorhabdus sp.]
MTTKPIFSTALTAIAMASIAVSTAPAAAKEQSVEVVKCDASYGTIAITDGDTQGWSKFGLSSPRGMLGAIVQESGCFTLHTGVDGQPTNYLMSAIAGSQEEVDQTMNVAKTALTEGLVRSGAASTVLSKVPMGGALMGMFGGLGGKKKTITAGLRLMNPANGQTLIAGSGQSKKSTIKILGRSDWVSASQGQLGQYGSSKDGKMVTSAFIEAFNGLASQAGALAAVQQTAAPAATASTSYTVAVETKMLAGASDSAAEVRALRADTELVPTGNKAGLFVEVTDNYGTKGWVSVEDLR